MKNNFQFNINDVITLITYHFNTEPYDHIYTVYNFAQIIDIKNNCYVLDLKYLNENNKYENILIDTQTNKSNNYDTSRYYQKYLKDKEFVDKIEDLKSYYSILKNYIQKTFKDVISNKLHLILNLYCSKLNVKTSLEISNAKDEIFLSFNSIMPIIEQKNKHERVLYWLHNIIHGNKSEINRCYRFLNELLNSKLTKDELNNFYIDDVNLNIEGENIK